MSAPGAPPRPPDRRWSLGRLALGAVLLVGLGWGGWVLVERRGERVELQRMREALRTLRSEVLACRADVAGAEARFRRFDARVDSLRAAVRAFETEDGGRVAGDRYPDYLEAFETYNDAVATWRRRVQVLEARDEACRARVVEHNALTDSIRTRLEARDRG